MAVEMNGSPVKKQRINKGDAPYRPSRDESGELCCNHLFLRNGIKRGASEFTFICPKFFRSVYDEAIKIGEDLALSSEPRERIALRMTALLAMTLLSGYNAV
jgi:hypothetical protein